MKILPRILVCRGGRTLLCSLATALTAMSLGACRGMPQFLQPKTSAVADAPAAGGAPVVSSPQTYRTPNAMAGGASPNAFGSGVSGAGVYRPDMPASYGQSAERNPEYGDYYGGQENAGPTYGPVQSPPPVHAAPPSPALPQAAVDSADNVRPVSHDEPQGQVQQAAVEFTPAIARTAHIPRTLPESAYTGHANCCADPRYPPQVWHLRRDEFLCDGGDQKLEVRVNPDWTVRGLDLEDTVVHYDTLEGATQVEPSNQVCIYAPRFAAVRQTFGPSLARVRQRSAGVEMPLMLVEQDEVASAGAVNQPLQPGRNVGLDQLITLKDRNAGVALEGRKLVSGLDNGFMLYENLLFIRSGQFDNSEKVRLADSIESAVVWSDEQAVQMVIDGEQAAIEQGVVEALEINRYEVQGKPRMRICKVASKREAQPGDIIHFTLRFDNIGNQEVGNVTIIDNLTTRLEYIPDSSQCSLKATFVPVENQVESLVLRWEIEEPIQPGEGGVIRFKCRVR